MLAGFYVKVNLLVTIQNFKTEKSPGGHMKKPTPELQIQHTRMCIR